MTSTIAPITLDIETRAAPSRAWAYLTDPELVARWFADASALGEPGDTYRIDFGDGSVIEGQITAVEPGRRFEHEWAWLDDDAPGRTLVRWEVTPLPGGGARISLVHEGWDAAGADDAIARDSQEGAAQSIKVNNGRRPFMGVCFLCRLLFGVARSLHEFIAQLLHPFSLDRDHRQILDSGTGLMHISCRPHGIFPGHYRAMHRFYVRLGGTEGCSALAVHGVILAANPHREVGQAGGNVLYGAKDCHGSGRAGALHIDDRQLRATHAQATKYGLPSDPPVKLGAATSGFKLPDYQPSHRF